MAYYVYILHSPSSDKYYVGQSQNPARRLEFHNSIEKGFTSRYRPWMLVYSKECAMQVESRVLEQKIKNWKSKVMIRRLVAGEIVL